MQSGTYQGGLKSTRRTFLKTTGVVATGISLSGGRSASAQGETLALKGGPKAVTVPIDKLTRWPLYGEEEEKAVLALLRNPGYGPIAEFEDAWKKFFDVPFAKAHCNGTSALTSMLFALDLPPGSEILVPSYSTWFPVVPMRFFGYVPVWVDSNPGTLNIDVESCKRKLTKNTKAVLAVHWFGVPCEMDHLCAWAKEKGIIVLEDCSHAHGAAVQGKLTGQWSRMSGFSLQMGKPLPAIEGGMGMYNSREDFERAVVYGNYDLPKTFPKDSPYRKYDGTALGGKLRIHPLAAILGRIQLSHLKEHNKRIVTQMARVNDRLAQLPGLSAQVCRPDMDRVYYRESLLVLDEAKAGMSRDACVKALKAEGAAVGSFQWTLLHTYPVFHEAQWGWHHLPADPGDLPGCTLANRTIMTMPLFTQDAPEAIDQYVKAFEKVWAHRKELA